MIRILLSTRLGERRWTQADLSRKTGIRANTINDLYHDIAARVSLEHLDLICEALECDLCELIMNGTCKGPFSVTYFDSANNRLIQIADVYANWFYSHLQTGAYSEELQTQRNAGIVKGIFEFPLQKNSTNIDKV